MATQPITTSLPAYVEQNKLDLIAKAVLAGRTIEKINLQTGCKGTTAINLLSTDVQFTDGKTCGFTPKGSQTFTQREIKTGKVKINMEYCADNFMGKYTQYAVRYSAGQETLPFEEKLTNDLVDNISLELDKCIWQGDTSQSDNRKPFDGFIKTLKATDCVKVPLDNAVSAIEAVKKVYLAIPSEALNERTAIFCSPSFLRQYNVEMFEKNSFHHDNGEDFNEIKLPYGNVRLIAVAGLELPASGERYLVAGDTDNFYYGTDMKEDAERFSLTYSVDSDTYKLAVKFIAGVQVAFPAYAVLATIAGPA